MDILTMFNNLTPTFFLFVSVGLVIYVTRGIIRALRNTVDSPVLSLPEKPKNSDLLWPEKPKNDQVYIGDDGELVYGDPHQEGEPGSDPYFFHENS